MHTVQIDYLYSSCCANSLYQCINDNISLLEDDISNNILILFPKNEPENEHVLQTIRVLPTESEA